MIDKETFNKYFIPEKISLPRKQSEFIALSPEYYENNIYKQISINYDKVYLEILKKVFELINTTLYDNNGEVKNIDELFFELDPKGYSIKTSPNRITLYYYGIEHLSVFLETKFSKTDNGIKAEIIYKFE